MATSPSSSRWWLWLGAILIVALAIVAAVLAMQAPAPPGPSASPGGQSLGSAAAASASPSPGGITAGGGGGGGAGGGGGGGGTASTAPSQAPSPPPSPSPSPIGDVQGAPYAVKQVQTLGGETISGFVCSTTHPFTVAAQTNKAAWTFLFVPRDAAAGTLSYNYTIPSAGESHAATGTYTLSQPDRDGTLHLSLKVSDHVVFHGFDGKIPVSYKFDLVPAAVPACPGP